MNGALACCLILAPAATFAQRADGPRAGPSRLAARPARVSIPIEVPTDTAHHTPPVHVALQLAAGLAGAWVGGVGAYKITELVANDRRVKGDEGYSPAGNVAFVVASLAGATLGTAGAGAMLGDHGSMAYAGFVALLPTMLLLTIVDDPYLPLLGIVLVAPLQAAGAVLGFAHRH